MGRNTFRRCVGRMASLAVIMLMFAISVSAYTVVMRGGRRVEIPASFVVTRNTLTYEVSPGIQITLALAAIDIPATEKANNEKPGSLLGRERADARNLVSSKGASGTRTITNRDLESSVQRRRASEAAYEVKRKELGLPTLEESRKRAATVPDLGTELAEKLLAEKDSEAYWRARATALRTEMTALDAELSYIRNRIEEVPPVASGWSVNSGTLLPFISFGNVGRGQFFPGRGMRRPDVFVAPRADAQLSGRVRFGGGMTRGGVFLNPGRVHPRSPFAYGRGGFGQPTAAYGPIGLVGQSFDYSYERNALITQLNELAAARAGLNARWRELEDEARRAGAQPGWLRR